MYCCYGIGAGGQPERALTHRPSCKDRHPDYPCNKPSVFDQGVEGLWIVFRDIKLNAGGIKSQDISKGRIDQVADRLREIDHLMEHLLDVRFKGGFEAGKKRGVRDFGKAAEIP